MISCLKNYIGVKGVAGYEQPDSDYFINDLEGITTDQLEEISDDDDHYEPRLAFDDIYNRGSRLLESDIKTTLKKYFKRYSYFKNGITGFYKSDTSTTVGANYNGWYFDLSYESKNLTLNLTSIDVYLTAAADFTIYIFDFVTGQELETIGVSGIAGKNTFRIEKFYPLHRYNEIFICYDEQEIITYKADDYGLDGLSLRRGNISKAVSIVSDNFNGAETGLVLNYNIECSVDNFVCMRLSIFKDAFLYKLGVEFCKERISSDRINRYTLMDRDQAIELKDSFEKQYKELLDNALRDLRVESDGVCFECNKAVNYKIILP